MFVAGGQDGCGFRVRGAAVTLAGAAAAVALARLAHRMIERLFRVDDDLDRRFPGLRQRAGLYRPVLTRAVDVVIMIVAFAVTMSAWGLDLYTPLGPAPPGAQVQSILVIAPAVVIGVSL